MLANYKTATYQETRKELFDEQAWEDNTERFVGKKSWI